jgi:hypothetical protein
MVKVLILYRDEVRIIKLIEFSSKSYVEIKEIIVSDRTGNIDKTFYTTHLKETIEKLIE